MNSDIIFSYNPSNMQVIKRIVCKSESEIALDIYQLKSYQTEWMKIELKQKIRLFRNFKKLLNFNNKLLASMITKEQGKPYIDSLNEVQFCEEMIDYFCLSAINKLKPTVVKTNRFIASF